MKREITDTPVTLFNENRVDPVYYTLTAGNSVIFSSRAPNKDTANEDALALIPVDGKTLVLVVADGLGGLPAGEAASRIAIDELIKSLKRAARGEIHIRGAIIDGIEQANRKILALKNGSATTLVVAEIQDTVLRTYHAGDSMIMLMSNRGKIKFSAIPHSPTGNALESGMINESEAKLHEDRHLISNCIGSADMRLEIGPSIKIAPRDTLILASDGLSDNLYDNEIVEACRKGPLFKAAKRLLELCRECMQGTKENRACHPDDLSFVMYRVK